jgi:nicotinamide-nucleotide amidase
VGTELLLGQIANTNAQKISDALAGIGIDVLNHQVVGDNVDRMVDSFQLALGRAEVVIVTGGLGPTPDDITREAVAQLTGRELKRREELIPVIQELFDRMGREMPPSNLRQVDLPEGATVIDPEGTAPGFWLEHRGSLLFALPGVPWEMEAMMAKAVLPELRARVGDSVILSREILVLGLGESRTHELIADIVDAQSNPTIAYRAMAGQVRVRLTAKAADEKTALGQIAPVEKELRERLGRAAVPGAPSSMGEALGNMLRDKGATVAVAESLTGGGIGVELTSTSGSGDYFLGSIVAYANEAKRDVVGIDEAILMGPGAVSEEAARALAEGAAQRFGADLGIGATGVAGPAEQDGQPVGTIYVAAAFGGATEVRKVRAYGDRSHVRSFAVNAALDLARRLLSADGTP